MKTRRVFWLGSTLAVLGFAPPWVAAASEASFRLDWPNWADVTSMPFPRGGSESLESLNDGDPATGVSPEPGPETGMTLQLAFPAAVQVEKLRLVVSGAYEIQAMGADRPGSYDQTLGTLNLRDRPDPDSAWITLPVGQSLRGLKLVATDGKTSYRSSYPHWREVQVFTATNVAVPKGTAKAVRPRHSLTPGEALPVPDPPRPHAITFTPCVDFWMLNLPLDKPIPDPSFSSILEKLREIDADGVRIFGESLAYGENKLPWRSEVGRSGENDKLKTFTSVMHEHDMQVDFMSHAWMVPFQKEGAMAPGPYRRWDYPYEQSDFVHSKGLTNYYTVKYPCIISDDDFRTQWTAYMKEVLDQGVDGVYVLPDEYYYKGHYLPEADCPSCRKAFKERYGLDMPGKVDDSETYRKWKQFEYDKVSELFNTVSRDLREHKPDAETIYCPVLYNPTHNRMEHGIAIDTAGKLPDYTGIMVYGGDPRHAGGAFPERKKIGSIQCLGTKGAWNHPVIFWEAMMEHLMNGCTGLNFYRLNYTEPYWDAVIKGARLMRVAEAWGLAESVSAAETCVLVSRASEDWWQTRADSRILDHINTKDSTVLYMDPKDLSVVYGSVREDKKQDDFVRETQYERFRGMYTRALIEDIYDSRRLPFDVRYAERPETLGGLSQYRLIVLPFAYSLSEETVVAIRRAVEAGARLLIVDSLAPTDEYGTPVGENQLEPLVAFENVVHIPGNVSWQYTSRSFRESFWRTTVDLIDSPNSFESFGKDVRYRLRKTSDGGRILYLANMEREESAAPVIGLDVPDGNYKVTLCGTRGSDLTPRTVGVREGRIHGRMTADPARFRNFGLTLHPGEVQLVRITPIEE